MKTNPAPMKLLLPLLCLLSSALCLLPAEAATPIKDARLTGAAEQTGGTFTIQTGVVWTWASGSALAIASGSALIIDGGATLTLADDAVGWAKVNKTGSSLANLATRSAADLSSGTLPDARFPATLPAASGVNLTALTGANITWADNVRITLNPGTTNAGLNVGGLSGDPSSPSNGDLWYDSTAHELTARINGANVALGAGGGGSGTFIGLTDVPASFSGAGGKVVKVNSGATALEFVTGGGGVTDFTDLGDVPSSYTGQGGKLVTVNSGATALEFIPRWSTAPTTATTTASAGELAYDTQYLYVAVATNSWRRLPLETFFADVYTYVSDGDTNGVFYGLGVIAGSGTWTNPHTAGAATLSSSSGFSSGTAAALVDRTASDIFGGNTLSHYKVDFGAGRQMVVTKYSYRARSSSGSFPTAWVMEGSADDSTWTAVSTVSGISVTSSSWLTTTVTGAGGYRYLRLRSTAADSSTFNYFTAGELEFYGTLSY